MTLPWASAAALSLNRSAGAVAERMTRFLQDKLYEKVTMDQLAETLGKNKSYLIRLFKKVRGITPMQYYLQLKMDTACHLLRETDRPIKDIAEALHFYDPFYFSNYFRASYRLSPKTYRARYRS